MKKILYSLLILLLVTSCSEDVIELSNPNEVTTQTFWKTETDIQNGLAATYYPLTMNYLWNSRGIMILNARSDDFFVRNDIQALYQISTFTNTPDNQYTTGLYSLCYQMIFRANQVIGKVNEIPGLSDDKKKAYAGEAKFLRGLAYFLLVNNFGEVPLVTRVAESKADYFVKKSTLNEVWTQVKNDFKDAADGLPVSYSADNVGRATKGAALAFLGKSHLYTKDWDAAIANLLPLTKAPYSYELLPNFGDNFTIPGESNKKETIFEVIFKDTPGAGYQVNYGEMFFAPAEVQGWFEAFPTNKLFDAFQKEKTLSGDFDPRMYATLVWDYPGATFYNKPFSAFKTPFPQFKSMFKKYLNYYQNDDLKGSAGTMYHSDNNKRIMRYDHVLLMLAEAYTMKNQLDNVTGANFYLNQIRKRANLDLTKTLTYNQQQMTDEVRHQYMLEFAREEQRFYDLRRWGILKNELTNSDKVGKEFFIEGKYDYFPIPQAEITSNPAMEQNSQWK